ncbi:MAG: hypothetical protein GW946_02495 [Candidatus Pacebacteria bacterium]|nr:hypothetical protein [Candidatus Paceibacterota bacterium]PIR60043.1 MAG: hypothetical protein COU67_03840 [Candidatus Pacebacteria bacterium CG10_big_fil_rev_8_21_14_0_10_44_54]
MSARLRRYPVKHKRSIPLVPALSILLIGGGLIAAMLISKGGFDFRRQASENSGEVLRDQFGIGSSCGIAAEMGIPWMYAWGHGSKYPNSAEVDCNRSKGLSFFFTIGKTDNAEKYPDLGQWEAKWILPEEEAAYEAYKNLLAQSTKPEYYPNAIASYVLIPMYITELGYKGAYYAVANEPDFEPLFRPELYADFYKLIHDRIKKYDNTAKVSVGGLLEVAPESCSRPQSIGVACGPEGDARFAWLTAVRDNYQAKHGTSLPVDFWNIHPYVYAYNFSAAETLDRVDQFKAYLDRIGEGNKKIWITEYAVLEREGALIGKPCSPNRKLPDGSVEYCLPLEDRMREQALMADFVEEVTRGFMARDYVERWFYFYGGESWSWSQSKTNYVGDIYKVRETGEYNEIGKRYMQLIRGEVSQPRSPAICDQPCTDTFQCTDVAKGGNPEYTCYRPNAGNGENNWSSQWIDISEVDTVPVEGRVTSFMSLTQPDGSTKQYLTKGGELYVRTSDSNGQNWSGLIGPNKAMEGVGSGPITGFSAAILRDGRIRQHAVKGGAIWSRFSPDNQDWSTWEDHTINVQSVGSGEITSFSVFIQPDGVLKQYYIRGGELWVRTQSPQGDWGEWTGSNADFDTVGSGDFTSFSGLSQRDGSIKQFGVRGGKIYVRDNAGGICRPAQNPTVACTQ